MNYRALGRKRGVQAAIKRALRKVVSRLTRYGNTIMDWIKDHVPYKTGNLRRSVRRILRDSTMTRIKLGAGAKYALYVSAFNPPINWTRTDARNPLYHFFERYTAKVESWLPAELRKALQDEDLKKWVKMSYTRMVEAIITG